MCLPPVTSLVHAATRRLVPHHAVLWGTRLALHPIPVVDGGVAAARARVLVEELWDAFPYHISHNCLLTEEEGK